MISTTHDLLLNLLNRSAPNCCRTGRTFARSRAQLRQDPLLHLVALSRSHASATQEIYPKSREKNSGHILDSEQATCMVYEHRVMLHPPFGRRAFHVVTAEREEHLMKPFLGSARLVELLRPRSEAQWGTGQNVVHIPSSIRKVGDRARLCRAASILLGISQRVALSRALNT